MVKMRAMRKTDILAKLQLDNQYIDNKIVMIDTCTLFFCEQYFLFYSRKIKAIYKILFAENQ